MKIFVSFYFNNPDGGDGFGNTVAHFENEKWLEESVVEALEKKVAEKTGHKEIVLLNFVKLEQ